MIYLLVNWLKTELHWKIPSFITYTSTRMGLALITALLISILVGPLFIRILKRLKLGQTIRKEECPKLGELHSKKEDTPTMGGILILFAMVISLFLWMDLKSPFTLLLFITTAVLGIAGGYDDFLKLKYKNTKGLTPRKKLIVQVGLALFVASYLYIPAVSEAIHVRSWFPPPVAKEQVSFKVSEQTFVQDQTLTLKEYASQLYFPFMKTPIWVYSGLALLFGFLFTAFVVTGASNAVNLTDGLDGLAAGCLIMAASCFALIAFVSNNVDIARYLHILYIEGSGEIAIYLSAMVGACLGFLWYNAHPAELFMGDIGSLTLGAVIGVTAVLLRREFLLGIIGGIFVLEALSVVLQVLSFRLRDKKRTFLCAPIHHHFEYKGWPETKVVVRFWILSFLFAIIGVLSLKIQ